MLLLVLLGVATTLTKNSSSVLSFVLREMKLLMLSSDLIQPEVVDCCLCPDVVDDDDDDFHGCCCCLVARCTQSGDDIRRLSWR